MAPFSVAPFVSGFFWVFLGLFVSGYWLLTLFRPGQTLRNLYIIGISIGVVCLVQAPETRFFSFLFLSVATLSVYVVGRVLLLDAFQKRHLLSFFAVILIVTFLCYFKYTVFQQAIDQVLISLKSSFSAVERHLFVVGVSYFSFKYIHFLVECHNRKIKDLNFLTFVSYIFFFPGFFIGPINRYPNFRKDMNCDVADINILWGMKRVITGLFKKVVLSSIFFPYSIIALDLTDPSMSKLQAFLGVYAYGLYVYFDFSGYSDMAIGSGRMVGIRLPENFNQPFLKRNLQQFWANWHMSLTAWLTDYIYWPLIRRLRHIKTMRRRTVTISCIGIIVTFMVCGIWHGDGKHYLYWGTFHGVGLALLNIYRHVVKKSFSRKMQIFINKSRVSYVVSNFVTVNYVCFSFIFFAFNQEQIKSFFSIFL